MPYLPEEQRPPLSSREYAALRQLFGLVSSLSINEEAMKKRLKLVPDGWRDYRMLQVVSESLLHAVMNTIPLRKLQLIYKELHLTRCQVVVDRSVVKGDDGTATVVDSRALERITEHAMQVECFACQKTGAEARNCQLRKDIEALYMWDFPKIPNGKHCHFTDGLEDIDIERYADSADPKSH